MFNGNPGRKPSSEKGVGGNRKYTTACGLADNIAPFQAEGREFEIGLEPISGNWLSLSLHSCIVSFVFCNVSVNVSGNIAKIKHFHRLW